MLRKMSITITLLALILSTHLLVAAEAAPAAAPATPDAVTNPSVDRPGVYSIDYSVPSDYLDPNVFPVDGQIGFWVWGELNLAPGQYDWDAGGRHLLTDWIKTRGDAGLRPAIMISTYDTATANDIRSTPDWVIRLPGAVLPVTLTNGLPHFIDYYHRTAGRGYNGEFELGSQWWTISDTSAITVTKTPPADSYVSATPTRPDRPAKGQALMLGGANGVSATISHDKPQRLPQMPPQLDGQTNAYITARVNIVTTDPNPNDHLYLEAWDQNNQPLGPRVDVTNLANAGQSASYWREVKLDLTPFALGKTVKVALRVVNDGSNPTTFYVDNVQLRVRHLIPKYWTDPYKKAYKDFIGALGARFKTTPPGGDPKYDLAFVGMGTGAYGESQPTQDMTDWEWGETFDHVVIEAGMDTTEKWQAWVNEVTDTYAAAFSLTPGGPPAKPLMLQYAPTFLDPQEKGYTSDHAAAKGVGLCHSRLIPDWTQLYKNNKGGAYDPIRNYWGKVATAFEGDVYDLGCSPVLSYWAVVGAVGRHADYLRVDPLVLQDANGGPSVHAPVFAWARQYLGKTVKTAPSAWTVMWEHRNPTMLRCGATYYLPASGASVWPEFGNFNYWLMQDDTIPGGRTVAETNDKGADRRYAKDPSTGTAYTEAGLGNCPEKSYSAIYNANPPTCNPQPYNPNLPVLVGQNPSNYKDFYYPYDWTGGGKEAYVARRTDQANGNPFMFFRVDDGYISASTSKVKITVGYFDIGTDQWSLKYQSAAGEKVAGTVTKKGTKAYKEISFTLSDAKLANGLTGGADFYLDSRSAAGAADGDEWLHVAQVEKVGAAPAATETPSPSPTPTSTPTATASPTGTETPTITPTVTPSATPSATVSATPSLPPRRVFLPLLLR